MQSLSGGKVFGESVSESCFPGGVPQPPKVNPPRVQPMRPGESPLSCGPSSPHSGLGRNSHRLVCLVLYLAYFSVPGKCSLLQGVCTELSPVWGLWRELAVPSAASRKEGHPPFFPLRPGLGGRAQKRRKRPLPRLARCEAELSTREGWRRQRGSPEACGPHWNANVGMACMGGPYRRGHLWHPEGENGS